MSGISTPDVMEVTCSSLEDGEFPGVVEVGAIGRRSGLPETNHRCWDMHLQIGASTLTLGLSTCRLAIILLALASI